MPWRGRPQCRMQGCGGRAQSGSAYCSTHAAPTPSRSALKASGSTRRWKRIRQLYLFEHPLCEWPNCQQVATIVDHIRPRRAGGDDSERNLRGLCREHDAEARRQPRSFGPPPEPEIGGFA